MDDAKQEFSAHVGVLIRRFLAQNGGAPLAATALNEIAGRLWTTVCEHGLPRPLGPAERGEPGGMPDEECAAIVLYALGGVDDPLTAEALRQIVKACFHPEFKVCRDSFREVSPDGSCRRQDLARVRRRVSGTHCVDCPYWVSLPVDQHRAFVRKNWRAGPGDFDANQPVFLPDDFRAFRRWLHAAARKSHVS